MPVQKRIGETPSKAARVRGALLAAAVLGLAQPAQAADAVLLELLEALHANGTLDRATYETLRRAAQAESASPPADAERIAREVEEQVAAATAQLPKIDTKGKLQVSSPEGDFKWRLGGRVMADAAFYDNDSTALGSGTEFRRARLYMSGTMWRVWDFKLQYDFTDTGIAGIRDAYIAYTGWAPANLTVGNYKEPFSLEELTSSKYITFMERALPNAFAPGRNIGAGFHSHGERWTLAGGFFGEGVDQSVEPASEGFGASARVTYAPILNEDATHVLHLGGAVSWRSPDDNDGVRFRERMESHVTNTRLVDTGSIDADDFFRYGVEAAWVWGPWSLQGEYVGVDVNRATAGRPDLDFSGWYVYGSWFLTGESRAYDVEEGAFGGIKPKAVLGKGGLGAWEVALRYSALDLTDAAADPAGVVGGEEENLTVGLNWYPNANIRFMANYVHVLDLKRPGHGFDNAEPAALQLRAQVHW